jgi:hypothetical protein
MKRPSFFALLLLSFVPTAMSVNMDAQSPEQALGAYVEGLQTGDLGKLKRAFLPNGHFCVLTGSKSDAVTCKPFHEVLDSWVAKPDPSASGRVIDQAIVEGSMARITFELTFAGRRYIDFLLLYLTGQEWRIVAKTTIVAGPPVRNQLSE